MLFPEVEKVIYKINCKESVTCQLRFPSVMKIENEGAVSFKELVNKNYPEFSKSIAPTSDETEQSSTCSGNKIFVFCSKDGKWKINLKNNNLSLSTTNYHDWEDFKNRLQIPLKALIDSCKIDHFNQIGLRTVYIFMPSKLGLKDVVWKNLVSPGILGVLALEDMAGNIENLENISFIRLANRNTILKIGTKTVRMTEKGEIGLTIDEDLSETADRGLDQIEGSLNHLNAGSTRMFRWGIKDRLHKAMKPETV